MPNCSPSRFVSIWREGERAGPHRSIKRETTGWRDRRDAPADEGWTEISHSGFPLIAWITITHYRYWVRTKRNEKVSRRRCKQNREDVVAFKALPWTASWTTDAQKVDFSMSLSRVTDSNPKTLFSSSKGVYYGRRRRKSTYLNELNVRKPSVVSISQRS